MPDAKLILPSHRSTYRLFGLLLVVCLSLLSHLAMAAIPPQVKFKPIVVSELEKLGYINKLLQDQDGFLWIGAIQGLARFDGYNLKTYLHNADDPRSLSHNWVKSLIVDHQGKLWAITHTGLCQYLKESEQFDCIQDNAAQSNSFFYAMYKDSQGQYWVSTSRGITLLDIERREFLPAPTDIHNALLPAKDSEDNFVHQITEDKQGNLWFALEGNGLIRYNPQTQRVSRFQIDNQKPNSLPANRIRAVLVDSKGTLWVGSLGGGVSRFDPITETFTHFKHSGSEKADTVWAITESPDGLLWIGDGTGIHIYDPSSGNFADYTYVEGSMDGPGNFVGRDILIDNAGDIWLGYFPSGVDTVDLQASQFLNYRHNPADPSTLADGGVLSTLEAPNGDLWVGCGFGLSLLNRKSGTFTRYAHDQNNPNSISGSTVLDMAMDADGTLWIGAWGRGLNRHIPGSNTFKHYTYDAENPNSLYGTEPWGTLVDSNNTLWVTTDKGINRYRPATDDFERILPSDETGTPLNSLYARYLYQDSNGTIWVASFNGLYGLNPQTNAFTHHFKHDPNDPYSISSDQLLTVFEDSDGDLWIGTDGNGLNRLDRKLGKFQRYSHAQGLPNPTISGIIEDNNGDLWLSTFQGLARYDKKQQLFTSLDKRDGPVGNLYNRNSPSKLSSGELVFGSSRGLTIFNPNQLQANPHIPPVVITEFSIFNKPVLPSAKGPLKQAITQAKTLDLNYKQSVFSFEFAALSFRSPDKNQYAYRMRGFERNWNNVGNRRTATYTNLDPGEYIFEVKGSNNNGVWNSQPTQIKISVAPPYWQSPLAYIIYAFAIISVVLRSWMVHRAKISDQQKRLEQERALNKRLKEIDIMKDEINRDLDKKVAERTEELRQEHQRVIAAQEELQGLNQKLASASVTDPLTGLKNRRFLHQVISDDTAIITRQYINKPNQSQQDDLTFLLLDIDRFKSVNDRYGHSVGDEVLVQLSAILNKLLRESDYIVRWGGEEFIIVIRYLPRAQVAVIVERLIASIKQHPFVINKDLTLHQTCSIGIAAFPFVPHNPKEANWEQVINLADKALYCAKASGRDCWVWIESSDNTNNTVNLIDDIEDNGITAAINEKRLVISSSKLLSQLVWK